MDSNVQNTDSLSIVDEIKKLHGLLQEGILTQEEFDKQKTILLNRNEAVQQAAPPAPQQQFVTPAAYSPYDSASSEVRYRQQLQKLHTKGTMAIVFAFISPLVAWIIGGIGISNANQMIIEFPNKKGFIEDEKSRCSIGIVLGVVVLIIACIIIFRA